MGFQLNVGHEHSCRCVTMHAVSGSLSRSYNENVYTFTFLLTLVKEFTRIIKFFVDANSDENGVNPQQSRRDWTPSCVWDYDVRLEFVLQWNPISWFLSSADLNKKKNSELFRWLLCYGMNHNCGHGCTQDHEMSPDPGPKNTFWVIYLLRS